MHISYSAHMPIAMIPGQQMDPNLMSIQGIRYLDMSTLGKAMGTHYIYPGNPIGDIPNTPGIESTMNDKHNDIVDVSNNNSS